MLSCYPAIQLVIRLHTGFLIPGHDKQTSLGLPLGSAAHLYVSLGAFCGGSLRPASAAARRHQRGRRQRQQLNPRILDRGGQLAGSGRKHRRH